MKIHDKCLHVWRTKLLMTKCDRVSFWVVGDIGYFTLDNGKFSINVYRKTYALRVENR